MTCIYHFQHFIKTIFVLLGNNVSLNKKCNTDTFFIYHKLVMQRVFQKWIDDH